LLDKSISDRSDWNLVMDQIQRYVSSYFFLYVYENVKFLKHLFDKLEIMH